MNYLAFKKFLASSGLSTRRFGDLCGIGKTTVHRLAQPGCGGLTAKYVKSITPALMRACQDHLTEKRAAADAIHLILSDIFGEEFTPSIVTRAVLTPDMLRFFGLARDPFAAPRSPNEVFMTGEMRHALALLEDAVKFQGFAAVLAPVGAGKTVLKNTFFSPRSKVQSPKSEEDSSPPGSGGVARKGRGGVSQDLRSKIQNQIGPGSGLETLDFGPQTLDPIVLSPKFADPSRVTPAGIVAYILEAFHIKPRRSLLLAQRQLEDHLAKLSGQGTTVALCFDECHRLSDTTLTALKNFYELGTGGFERYLGLVLFGQPQFAARLTWPRFREIAERLAVFELPPFSAEDTANFLDHCFQKARLFSPGSRAQSPKPEEMPAADLGRGARAPSLFGLQSGVRGPTPQTAGDPALDSEHWTLDPLFLPDALSAVSSRAGTPLAVANLAAAAMIEAYRKGERLVTARFVPGEGTGPMAMRVGR